MIQEFIDEKPVETPEDYGTYSYEDVLGTSFKLVNPADCYQYDSQYQVWVDKSQDADYMKGLVRQGEDISVVGVVQPAKDANGFVLTSGIAYPLPLPPMWRRKRRKAGSYRISWHGRMWMCLPGTPLAKRRRIQNLTWILCLPWTQKLWKNFFR